MSRDGRKRPFIEAESPVNLEEMTDQDIDLQITNFAVDHGFESIDEFEQILALGLQAFANVDQQNTQGDEIDQQQGQLNSLFKKRLENSVKSRVSRIVENLDEGTDNIQLLNLKLTSDHFVDIAKQALDDSVDSTDENKRVYLLSLSPMTIVKASHSLAIYLEFVESFHGKNKGYGLDELKSLCYDLRVTKISELFSELASFFCESYKIPTHLAIRKGSENVEPSTIVRYSVGLFVAFKIIGIIEIGTTRKQLLGTKTCIETRKALRTLGTNTHYFKEKISPVDVIELLKVTEIKNIADLQCATFLLTIAESGIRHSSATAINENLNGFSGLKLRDLSIQFTRDKIFRIAITIRQEKANKIKETVRQVFLWSNARYCHLSSANLLLAFICICGYTTEHLNDCLRNEKVVIRPECLDLPLFCEIRKDLILTGAPLKYVEPALKWLSAKSGVPRAVISINSLRRGYATSLYENAYLKDNNATEKRAVENVLTSGTWADKTCQHYFSHKIGPKLLSFRVYNLSTENALSDIILENLACGVFRSEKFKEMRTTSAELQLIEEKCAEQYERKLKLLKANSNSYQRLLAIKEQYNIKEESSFRKNKKISQQDFDDYKTEMATYSKDKKALFNRIQGICKREKDQLESKKWYAAKRSIKLEDRYIPTKEVIAPALNFDLLHETMGHLVLPSPFGQLPFERNVDHSTFEPIACPFSQNADDCQYLQTPAEFISHRLSHVQKLNVNQRLSLFCHVDGCKESSKQMKENDYLHHMAMHHPSSFICSCGEKLSSVETEAHLNENSDHLIKSTWQFDAFVFPSFIDRCECSTQFELLPSTRCITQREDIRKELSSENLIVMAEMLEGSITKSAKQAVAKVIMLDILKTDTLPVCLSMLISKIE